MTSQPADRLRKFYAVVIIAGVLGAQFWMIVPRRWEQAWYWPFMNYPMYSGARYPGDEFSRYELWAGPAGEPELLRFVPNRELHLTSAKYALALRMATRRDGPIVYGGDESASDFVSRLVAGLMPDRPLRLQIWEHTWTLGRGGVEDRAGVRKLEREWTLACERGAAVSRCASEIP